LGLNSGPHACWAGTVSLELLHQPCFVLGIFEIRVSQAICPGLALNRNLLISTHWIARIIGMNHRHPALPLIFRGPYSQVDCDYFGPLLQYLH
jgi:hypothetical protein